MAITIYHNPRCSKSRKTLELIKENGHEPLVIEYLETPPAIDDIKNFLTKLSNPEELIRKKEDDYRTLPSKPSTPDEIAGFLAEHPKAMERPIVVNGGRVEICRPPEKVLEIL